MLYFHAQLLWIQPPHLIWTNSWMICDCSREPYVLSFMSMKWVPRGGHFDFDLTYFRFNFYMTGFIIFGRVLLCCPRCFIVVTSGNAWPYMVHVHITTSRLEEAGNGWWRHAEFLLVQTSSWALQLLEIMTSSIWLLNTQKFIESWKFLVLLFFFFSLMRYCLSF